MDGRMVLEEAPWSVVPEYDVSIPKAADGVEKRVSPQLGDLAAQAKRAVVWDAVSLSNATDLTKLIRVALKNIEEERTTITGPINKGLKTLNDKFKKITKPLSDSQRELDQKIIEFQMGERRRAEEAAEKARKELEVKALEQTVVLEETPPPAPLEVPSSRSQGAFGSTSMVDRWVYEVVDITAVPARYVQILPNDDEIKLALKAGVREISGLKIVNKPFLSAR